MIAFYKSTDQIGQALNTVYAEDVGQLVDVFSGQRDAGAMSLLGPLPTPNQAPTTALAAGAITGTAYQWALYWITGIQDGTGAAHIQGRTPFGTLSGGQALTAQKATITLPGGLTVPTGAIGWGVARNKSAGATWYSVPGSEQFLSLVGSMPSSFLDNVVDGALVTLAPTANTTGTSLTGATEAATVAGLGTGVDGRVGRLRMGSSPYDFIDVVYDATYGKWVSKAEEFSCPASNNGVNSVYADVSFAPSPPLLPWKPLDTAGLKPQFRAVFGCTEAGGDNGGFKIGWFGQDAGGAQQAEVLLTTGILTFSNAANQLKDTGWQDIAGGYTVRDFIFMGAQAFTSNNIPSAGRLSFSNMTMSMRWVG